MQAQTPLKPWREQRGYSQREAARRLGVSLNTYQELEQGFSFKTGKPRKLDLRTRLAAAALEHGIEPISNKEPQ